MAKMTIKKLLECLGIGDVDKEITLEEETTPPATPPTPPTTPPTNNDSSITEQPSPTVDPEIAKLQKEIAELKATNARLLTQTPVEHQQTADEALLELLGIGGKEDGNNESSR